MSMLNIVFDSWREGGGGGGGGGGEGEDLQTRKAGSIYTIHGGYLRKQKLRMAPLIVNHLILITGESEGAVGEL